jgi:D-alanine-D-alanine ligase
MRIAVLLGGVSVERDVSFASGRGVVNALRESGHDVIPIDPAFGANQPANLNELISQSVHADPPSLEELSKLSPRSLVECINSSLLDAIDMVFIALHGTWGEDGTIQSLLEMRGVRYTGSGVLSSALAMDKAMSKVIFQHFGVLTADWFRFDSQTSPETIRGEAERIGYPVVVKPNDGGSTVGLTVVQQPGKQLEQAVKLAAQYSKVIMLEKFIDGLELTVAIVGNDVLPIIEIKPKGGIYDYHHKYTKGMTEYICPAKIPENMTQYVSEQALLAFRSLGCSGFGRIDFRVNSDGDAYCLEVNTIPGMTGTSLVPKSAAAAGWSFPELCERIVNSASHS